MEEFLKYLFTVAILLVFVIRRKKRPQSAEQPESESESEPGPMNWPLPPVRPQRAKPGAGNMQRIDRRQGSVPGKEARKEVRKEVAPQVHPTHVASGSNPAPPAVMEDFDLRKAVVWSEVLQPKFKEEGEE